MAYANGLNVTYLYGSDGFLQKSIAVGAQATNTYVFQNGELASRTTPLGLTLSFTHDQLGRLTGVGFPDGTTLTNVFDKLDLVAAKDRLGHWSYATYDELRQLQTVTDRNGGSTSFSYCNCGGLQGVTDPEQHATTYLRDYQGRITNVVSAAGSVVIERDNLGRPFHVSSTWGLDLRLGHNYQGLLTGITNPIGTALSVEYDVADMPVGVTDGAGVTATRSFDTLGRLTWRQNVLGQYEEYEYSAQGLSCCHDAVWNSTYYGYDSAGRLCAITNRNNEVNQIGYDVPHRRMSLTDGRNHTKWWGFDTYGRQVAETNANGVLVKTNGYDANSNLTAEWNAARGLTTLSPDNNGNILAIHYPNATINYTYDHLDRLLTMGDGLGNHTFGYTSFGAFDWALASEDGPLGTISHGYSGPNLASISINSSVVESITRDAALRPGTISSFGNNFTYSYKDGSRQLASLGMPGSANTFGYDAAGELLSVGVTNSAHTVLDYHGYDYNENGWITAAHRLGGVTVNYGQDNIGQLTSAQAFEPDGYTLRRNEDLTYTYDASHNLATRTAHTLTQTFTSDAANQLSTITRSGTLTVSGSITGAVATLGVNGQPAAIYSDGTFATTSGLTLRDGNNMFVTTGSNAAGALVLSTISSNRLPVTVNLSYDLNGNLTGDGQRVLEYDDANRLTAVTVSSLYRTEFVYDGLNRRRIVRDYTWSSGNWQSAGETDYVCDGYLPIQERDASGNVLVTYTRGPDLSGTFGGAGGIGGLLARTDGSGSAFYHADIGGNITSLTDSSGNAVARYLQDPFGRALGMSGPLAGPNVMRGFSMPYYERADFIGYAFRLYGPSLQRWLNQDPIGEMGGMNLYGFVSNDPVNGIDPLGWSDENHPPNISLTLYQLPTHQPVYYPPGVASLSEVYPWETWTRYSPTPAPGPATTESMTLGSNPDVTGRTAIPEITATIYASLLPFKCTATEGGIPQFIYRTGSQTENALTDAAGVSFRDSISSSADGAQVFDPGAKIWAVDTSKLSPGSVVLDGNPAGHVSVFATPSEIRAAIVPHSPANPLADFSLKLLEDGSSYRIPKK